MPLGCKFIAVGTEGQTAMIWSGQLFFMAAFLRRPLVRHCINELLFKRR